MMLKRNDGVCRYSAEKKGRTELMDEQENFMDSCAENKHVKDTEFESRNDLEKR